MQLAGALDWPTKLGLYRAHVERQGHDWHCLRRRPASLPPNLHNSLFELDVRFGDIADTGFVAELMRAGERDPGLVDDSDVEQAQKEILDVARRLADAGDINLGQGGEEYV